ncbi:hypothetical protein LJR153_007170 [Paenibacillus sp. LjRoot153]|uniref:hypothetical protein n=1 Tax=Paenibacillus sp. LjRoot153 TaxID=3342270 RepID=UPI003ECD4047
MEIALTKLSQLENMELKEYISFIEQELKIQGYSMDADIRITIVSYFLEDLSLRRPINGMNDSCVCVTLPCRNSSVSEDQIVVKKKQS